MQRRDIIFGVSALGVAGVLRGNCATAAPTFFVPPEEAPHQRTFLQWPANRRVYRDPVFLDMVQQTIVTIANTIAEFEPVILLAGAQDHPSARRRLTDKVELWDIPTDDLWCRDAGPIFVSDGAGTVAVRQIQFNGWGEKQSHAQDKFVAARVAERLGLDLLPSGLHGEAGGVEQNGHGLLIAHESSWVTDNRNPGLSRDEIEQRLLAAYGADRMIWSDGVGGLDITDYHIDSLARFTGPDRVLVTLPSDPDPKDPFHAASLETYETLLRNNLDVEVIPEPHGRRVAHPDFVASYANFYVCNGAVISAQFGDQDSDEIAREALQRHYSGREIVMLDVDVLGELGGGIHCATQQMPKA